MGKVRKLRQKYHTLKSHLSKGTVSNGPYDALEWPLRCSRMALTMLSTIKLIFFRLFAYENDWRFFFVFHFLRRRDLTKGAGWFGCSRTIDGGRLGISRPKCTEELSFLLPSALIFPAGIPTLLFGDSILCSYFLNIEILDRVPFYCGHATGRAKNHITTLEAAVCRLWRTQHNRHDALRKILHLRTNEEEDQNRSAASVMAEKCVTFCLCGTVLGILAWDRSIDWLIDR